MRSGILTFTSVLTAKMAVARLFYNIRLSVPRQTWGATAVSAVRSGILTFTSFPTAKMAVALLFYNIRLSKPVPCPRLGGHVEYQ